MKRALQSDYFIWILVAASLSYVVWFNFQKFVLEKKYDFYVEAPCDPEIEVCYLRDCEEGECPPNDLAEYKVWRIVAGDFQRCTDSTCKIECESNLIECEPILCDSQESECSEP